MTDRFWELMARNWNGNITREEKAELEQYLLEHPEYWLKAGLEKRLSYKANTPLPTPQAEQLADDVLARIQAEEAAEQARHSLRQRRVNKRRAAFLLVTLISGILCFTTYYYQKPGTGAQLKEIATIPGMKTSINLADGTTVWLNAGSKLRYPAIFNKQDNMREVFLEGEGYFQVKHNESKPFIIHTRTMDVKVLGTTLNVRAYADEDFSETVLVNGAVIVAVHGKEGTREFYLKPRQKVVVKNEEDVETVAVPEKIQAEKITLEPIQPVSDSVIVETAWREEKLVFRDETFSALALRLERWYGVKIAIEDTAMQSRRFSGRADNVSLEQLLSILKTITPFEYEITEREVIIQ